MSILSKLLYVELKLENVVRSIKNDLDLKPPNLTLTRPIGLPLHTLVAQKKLYKMMYHIMYHLSFSLQSHSFE